MGSERMVVGKQEESYWLQGKNNTALYLPDRFTSPDEMYIKEDFEITSHLKLMPTPVWQ